MKPEALNRHEIQFQVINLPQIPPNLIIAGFTINVVK